MPLERFFAVEPIVYCSLCCPSIWEVLAFVKEHNLDASEAVTLSLLLYLNRIAVALTGGIEQPTGTISQEQDPAPEGFDGQDIEDGCRRHGRPDPDRLVPVGE